MLIKCELCSDTAGVYCPSDSAYLCWSCDSSVHSANFLVARHARSTLCSSCGDFDGESFSGAGIRKPGSSAGCQSCGLSVYDDEEEESSLSSVCVSTNESSTVQARGGCGEVSRRERRGRAKVEGVLVNWGRRMGLGGEQSDVVLGRAAEVMRGVGACLPVRVALAASFWVGLRLCGGDTCRDLKRVERVTGVPGKMILAVEGKLERVLKTRRGMVRCDDDYEEGWAEC